MWILEEMKMRQKSDQAAIVYREEVISFQKLWNKSEKAADYILQNSRTQAPVLIYGNKENDMVTVILACLRCYML